MPAQGSPVTLRTVLPQPSREDRSASPSTRIAARRVAQRDVVELDVLARGDVALVERGAALHHLREGLHLLRRDAAEGQLHPDHLDVGLALAVDALLEPEADELVLGRSRRRGTARPRCRSRRTRARGSGSRARARSRRPRGFRASPCGPCAAAAVETGSMWVGSPPHRVGRVAEKLAKPDPVSANAPSHGRLDAAMDPRLDATGQADARALRGGVAAGAGGGAPIERIEALNGELNAVIHPLFEKALETEPARRPVPGRAVRGQGPGLPHGRRPLPRGHALPEATSAGPRRGGHLAGRAASARPGFVFVGRTNTPELGHPAHHRAGRATGPRATRGTRATRRAARAAARPRRWRPAWCRSATPTTAAARSASPPAAAASSG